MIQKKIEQLTKNRIVHIVDFIVLFMVTINCTIFTVWLTIQSLVVFYQEQPNTLGEVKQGSTVMGSLLSLINILVGILIAFFISVARKRWNEFFRKNKSV
ncbi:hypothetical protein OIX16_002785 [Enterococcus faecalis]|nr:hypothetical protein [Enterococcus faecalis]